MENGARGSSPANHVRALRGADWWSATRGLGHVAGEGERCRAREGEGRGGAGGAQVAGVRMRRAAAAISGPPWPLRVGLSRAPRPPVCP